MLRNDFEKLINTTYGVYADYPWISSPSFAVFRHSNNKKWFAVVMTITEDKLTGRGNKEINVVNLKCPQEIIGSVVQENGVYPAYHMSKSHWISAVLDGNTDDGLLQYLLAMSYQLTENKK